jgi:hypothetical protein
LQIEHLFLLCGKEADNCKQDAPVFCVFFSQIWKGDGWNLVRKIGILEMEKSG